MITDKYPSVYTSFYGVYTPETVSPTSPYILARPDHVFEAAFSNTDDGPVWVDLTDYIELQEGLTVGRRRQTVFDDVAAATLSLSLDNSDGTFNTDRTDSPFYGRVDLDVPLRFRLRWPNVPDSTGNMLSDKQSTAADANEFTCGQGGIDVDTSDTPSGQTSDIIWSTGVLDQTGVSVMTGFGPTRSPGDKPIYVKPGRQYSARVQVKCDAAGTGIGFRASLRFRWFDSDGNHIWDTPGTTATLTESYSPLTVTAISPMNAASARLGVFSETVVGPATRTIEFADGYSEYRNLDHIYARIPSTVDAGALALVWLRIANKNIAVSTVPDGWEYHSTQTDAVSYTNVYYKFLNPDDIGKSYVWGINGKSKMLALLTCYQGVSQSSPFNIEKATSETIFQAAHITPGVSISVPNCAIVSAVFDTATATGIWSAPAGEYVRAIGYGSGGNAPSGIVTDDNTVHSAGDFGWKTYTSNASSRYATKHTIALAPAIGTGPGSVTVQLGAWEMVEGSLGTWEQGGHWYTKFTGLADSWTETFAGDLPLTAVQATDRQKQLSKINIGSAVYEDIRAQGPLAYWQLNESSGGTTTPEAANSADVPQAPLSPVSWGTGLGAGGEDPLQWGSGTGPGVDGTTAMILNPADANNGQSLSGVLSNPLSGATAFTLLQFWNSTTTDTSTHHDIIHLSDASNGVVRRGYAEICGVPGASGYLKASVQIRSDASLWSAEATVSGQYFDGKTHLLAGTFALTGGQLIASLYVDGTLASTATSATPVTEFPVLRRFAVGSSSSGPWLGQGTYSHSALFDYALSSDTIADINAAGTTGFSGDTVDQRISRIGGWEGQDGFDLDTGSTVLDRHMPDAQTLLSAIQQAARSVSGVAYINGDGNIAFRSRLTKEQVSAPLLTIAATAVDKSLSKATDDQQFVDKAVITRLATGAKAAMLNQDSVDAHQVREQDVDTILSSDQDAKNYAAYIIAFYSEPKPRYDQVKIDARLLQNWADTLQLDLWQMLRITDMPSTEANSALDLYVEGWEISIEPDHWYITFDTSSAILFAITNDPDRGVCGSAVVGW